MIIFQLQHRSAEAQENYTRIMTTLPEVRSYLRFRGVENVDQIPIRIINAEGFDRMLQYARTRNPILGNPQAPIVVVLPQTIMNQLAHGSYAEDVSGGTFVRTNLIVISDSVTTRRGVVDRELLTHEYFHYITDSVTQNRRFQYGDNTHSETQRYEDVPWLHEGLTELIAANSINRVPEIFPGVLACSP